jgi:hypothetical protein
MERHDKSNDRRSGERLPARSGVRFECRLGTLGLGPNILARVLNVSCSGAGLCLESNVSVKDEVELSIECAGMPPMKRFGNVVWVRQLGDGTVLVGVDFQEAMSYQDVQAITKSW